MSRGARVFVVCSSVPRQEDGAEGVTAVNIVLDELLKGLSDLGYEVVLQILFNVFRNIGRLEVPERNALEQLEKQGAVILPPVFPAEYAGTPGKRPWLGRIARLARFAAGQANLADFYPAVRMGALFRERVEESRADVILTVWSPEGVAATDGLCGRPRIAYHGDVDFVPVQVRMRDWRLFASDNGPASGGAVRNAIRAARRGVWIRQFQRAHLRLMRGVDVIANVTASNAEFYRRQGHPRSIYIRNTWGDLGRPAMMRQGLGGDSPMRRIKIVGHVGYRDRTGSTYGLRFLLVDLLPVMDEVMGGLEYEIHIIGGGEVVLGLRPWLRHGRVLVRGFVEDLRTELESADVILLLNNAGPYQAAYTRHLVAWSMGLCLVVHEGSVRAMPEIRHMENALVGRTPLEIARMVLLAATDRELNGRIRQGGRATYEKYFTPRAVAEAIGKEIEGLLRVR